MAPPLTGRRPLASEKAGLFLCFCCRPSLAEPSRETSRAQPNVAERSRAQPNPAPRRPPPPERRRASRRAASAAEEAPPQGEEVPARRRPPAAEAAPVAPRRERPAPEQQSAPSIPLPRTLPRARTGLNSGSELQADVFTVRESLSAWTGQPPWKAGYTGVPPRHGPCH
ncbi:hypothetical protein J1605_020844 [Eschrichtius robustus]|uniref:Uncharacterized protein n=1 Tax=Eschrichtius robustus TaxID=9764 RepID=A0AB34HFK8_ESCRO|nr:hypothetical protein J1605_020844 [Eschrichtius robustus]